VTGVKESSARPVSLPKGRIGPKRFAVKIRADHEISYDCPQCRQGVFDDAPGRRGSGGLSSFLSAGNVWLPLQGRDGKRCTLARADPTGRGQLERTMELIGLGGNQMAPYSRSQILGVAVHAKLVAMRADAALAEAHTSYF
jgi:hypothetical protein